MHDHGFRALRHEGSELVLVCACGWRSPKAPTGATVCERWDEHRAEMSLENQAAAG